MNESSTRNVDVEQIPLIELNSDNIHQEWDNLTNSLKDCTFISLDLEMSGLGKREELNDQSIDERYKNIRKAASSYSIFSFGISCFKICSFESDNRVIVKNKSFDLALLCSDHFMVDPESIQFLIFNKHDIALNFTKGIKYYRGNDRYQDQNYRQYPRELFSLISNAKKPIVLHNGLIDLIFMYQNFYANAPENLMKFLADLSELFQSGIYDTKFISEFYGRYNSTYLEYLYYKSLFENTQLKKLKQKKNCSIQFNQNTHLADFQTCDYTDLTEKLICNQFYIHGYCSKLLKHQCHKNHDLKKIFNFYIKKENCKTTRNDKNFKSIQEENKLEDHSEIQYKKQTMIHNAGIDAFMTGHVMLFLIGKISNFESVGTLDIQNINLQNFKDVHSFNFNINLSGKDFPLVIQKSNFHSISLQHREKKSKLEIK